MSSKEPVLFLNRELSWLEFNQRVLDEALDTSVPLLERLNFLAITGSNLDEFFMVRVGGLQMLQEQRVTASDHSGLSPGEQLDAISGRVHQMNEDQYRCYGHEIEPQLSDYGIRRLTPEELSDKQRDFARHYFENQIFPVVTPMALELARPGGRGVGSRTVWPLMLNLGLCVAVRIRIPATRRFRLAIIPVGLKTERFVRLPAESGYSYILVEDLIALFIEDFFPGETVLDQAVFRITRNADLSLREDMAGDLLAKMKEVLDARKHSQCVRLEISRRCSRTLLGSLSRALRVASRDIYAQSGPLDLSAFRKIATVDGFSALKYETWPPLSPPDIDLKNSIFRELNGRHILLYHPYDSFEPVVRLVDEAADDPNVLAIKQILYRTSRKSPIVEALRRAAENGKYVTAIVELKARFDEARNIEWARELEQAGVQVIYGVKGLKTHAKLCIVVRQEEQGIVRYLHFGTGNYNEITAKIYSDASYMTTDPDLANDASAFFNAVTGYSQPQPFLKLKAAPLGLRETFLELIDIEIERKRQGQKALIMAKMNSLVDAEITRALYRASKEGVKVLLNVRGICCLRPGVPGLSENISVISIVDRFLEHSRLYYFYHGGEDRMFISSADWMPRNLDRRVELMIPIQDPAARNRLVTILETYFRDNVKAHRLLPDGRYQRLSAPPGRKGFRSQEALYQEAAEIVKQLQKARRTVFEPYRPSVVRGKSGN